MKEDLVVSKVRELMETLDHIKRYKELSNSLRRFVVIVALSVLAYIGIRVFTIALRYFFHVDLIFTYIISFATLFIPIAGIIYGILIIRRRVRSVKTGEWKETLSQGFRGALELLSKIDWEATIEEINAVKSSSFYYGVARLASYATILFLLIAVIPVRNATSPMITLAVLLTVPVAAVFAFEGFNLIRRYRVSRSLDSLTKELRSFYSDFTRSEFEIV